MANDNKKPGNLDFLKNPKSRMLVAAVAGVVVVGGLIVINGVVKRNNASQDAAGATSTASLPAQAYQKQSIDPEKVDAKQSDLRKLANEEDAKNAEREGKTFVATMRPDVRQPVVAPENTGMPTGQWGGRGMQIRPINNILAEPEISQKDINDAQAEYRKRVELWKTRLLNDQSKINNAWEDRGFYSVVSKAPVQDAKASAQNAAGTATDAAKKEKPVVLAKAGDVFFGMMAIGLNTDEPSAVTAYILSGPFKGGTLVGAMAGQTAAYSDKAVIQFTSLNHPKFERSMPVRIFAVDPGTKRAALADSVDHHLFMRLGVAAAVDFAQGYADAKAQRTQSVIYGANGATTTINTDPLSNKQLIAAGVSKTMGRIGNELQPYVSRPNTIEVNSGSEIGLLVVTDILFTTGQMADAPAPPNLGKLNLPLKQTYGESGTVSSTDQGKLSERAQERINGINNLNNLNGVSNLSPQLLQGYKPATPADTANGTTP